MKEAARILIVEDNEDLADNVAELFDDLDGEVAIVTNADEALETAQTGFDLAILDIRLSSHVNAIDLMPQLREASPDSEIILMTGHGTLDSAIAAVRHGAFAYVLKPFDPKELHTLSTRALERVFLRRDRDELARKLAESAALAAMGRLTAGLAHEIRNPLNAAKLQLELLSRQAAQISDETLADKIASRASVVREEISSLSTMLDEFLSLARPIEMETEPFDLTTLVSEVIELQSPVATDKGVQLACECEPDLLALGDRSKIKQVLVNLITNAVEAVGAIEDQGRVAVTLRESRPGRVTVSVSDNGPGISEDLLDQVFLPFFTSKPAGTGLGLSIVEQLITAHEGKVSLSNNTDGGLDATFSLKRASPRS